jgi:hypothetical protein
VEILQRAGKTVREALLASIKLATDFKVSARQDRRNDVNICPFDVQGSMISPIRTFMPIW